MSEAPDIGTIIEALEQYTRGDEHQRAIEAAIAVLRTVESRESALIAERDALRGATGWNPITAPGQVGAGDLVTFTICDARHVRRVRQVLSSGQAREELIYDIKRNHYLITSMSMRNEGSQRNVMFHKRPPLPTLSATAVEGV